MDASILGCKFNLFTICFSLHLCMPKHSFNPILHIAWLDNYALMTLKGNTAKFYFGDKSSFMHTFLKFCRE
jgi:hypothetical protein